MTSIEALRPSPKSTEQQACSRPRRPCDLSWAVAIFAMTMTCSRREIASWFKGIEGCSCTNASLPRSTNSCVPFFRQSIQPLMEQNCNDLEMQAARAYDWATHAKHPYGPQSSAERELNVATLPPSDVGGVCVFGP